MLQRKNSYCQEKITDSPTSSEPEQPKLLNFELIGSHSVSSFSGGKMTGVIMENDVEMNPKMKNERGGSSSKKISKEKGGGNLRSSPRKPGTTSCPSSARRETKRKSSRGEVRTAEDGGSGKCLNTMEGAIKNIEQKFQTYESGDYLLGEDDTYKSEEVLHCLNNYGQSIKLNSTMESTEFGSARSSNKDELFEDTAESYDILDGKDQVEINVDETEQVDVIFEDEKKKLFLAKDISEGSIIESGYQTNSNDCSQASNPIESSISDKASNEDHLKSHELKSCLSDTQIFSTVSGCVDENKMREVFMNIFGCNAQVVKMIRECSDIEGHPTSILQELKKCLDKEIAIEKKLERYMNHNIEENRSRERLEFDPKYQYYDLKKLDESLIFVKENLTSIKQDLSEFKENCWNKIESKVGKSEFSDVTNHLRSKINHLERRILSEQRQLKQDIIACKEKLKQESDTLYGIRNFPFWPFVAFLGAYSIMYFGNKT